MKKKEWQAFYERLKPFFENAARRYYAGKVEKGFKFWSVSQILLNLGMSDDQLKEPLELDGSDDLKIDGYYVDEEESELILIQSKYHSDATAIGNDELNRFLNFHTLVLNPQVVAKSKNPLSNDAHRAALDAVSKGWTIRLVFVTSGYLSPGGREFADQYRESPLHWESAVVRRELEVYDIEGLEQQYKQNLVPESFNTDVELSIAPADLHVSSMGGFRVLVAAVAGSEIVKSFRKYKYGLFRLNPRGPLQSNVNRDIAATLNDKTKRKFFYHLNNGLTAICDGFTHGGGKVNIRGLQIVNGCQTTVMLDKMSSIVDADPDIKLLLKLFEGVSSWREEIAKATNTQARLNAQDMRSNDKRQRDLKKRFDALPSPICYEVKRGDWEMEFNKERYKEPQSKQERRIKMVDLAQATLAFLGQPGTAKDRARTIFEEETVYDQVFPEDIDPGQLLLPWETYQLAQSACQAWIKKFPGAMYARYFLVGAVGAELAPDKKLPGIREASVFRAKPERIGKILGLAQQAIFAVWTVLDKDYRGHREFFRSAESFERVLQIYRGLPE